ncbi:MAG: hypothetical protein AB1796_02650 [Bacillota bacterium]
MTSDYPAIRAEDMEKYSAAVTLSDMEIFIFPELLYSLLLANIMSPLIWEWKKDAWFKNMQKLTPYRKILRLKQFIMDNYDFNLDLETWGLTDKETELARFRQFMDEEKISKSNALFGYEGDKYYFSVDIRKHFGLDKYTSNIIPYWKTETIEAMDAFKFKPGYAKGAGECVSLSALYAAALFVVCQIPLEKIFLLATPLHSQNFIDINDGILTNNRRIVTKNMWFNGTELTAKAQRAMRHEQITIVAHNTGYVHVVYPRATMDNRVYEKFEKKLKRFLVTELDSEILYNFLRQESHLQICFQMEHLYNGKKRYIGAEKAYAYEHTSSFRLNDHTRENLFAEIDEYDFFAEPLANRICLNKLEDFFKNHKVNFDDKKSLDRLVQELDCTHIRKNEILNALFEFCHLTPRLPEKAKKFVKNPAVGITPEMSREEIIACLESLRSASTTADLAFYAYRDFSRTNWEPFIKAAVERNPVAVEGCKNLTEDEVLSMLESMPEQSIYAGPRVAQPDEVWNYGRGDGLEKAVFFASVLKNRNRGLSFDLVLDNDLTMLYLPGKTLRWDSAKGLKGKVSIG